MLLACGLPALAGEGSQQATVDEIVKAAYDTAGAGFPCRVKARGKPKMLRWEEVDRCLNGAAGKVDWEKVAGDLSRLSGSQGSLSPAEIAAMVEPSASAHMLKFEQVLAVRDPEALLPLTNSILKFLPESALKDLPVYDKQGTHVGSFLGTYSYERTGGLASANTYRLSLFQYTDRNGKVQPVSDKLLLDSFGVPWKDAAGQVGFRLPVERFLKDGKK